MSVINAKFEVLTFNNSQMAQYQNRVIENGRPIFHLENNTFYIGNGTNALKDLVAINAAAGDLAAHIADTSNPHEVTATQVGLGNVDNTSDLNKPISTATQTALDNKLDDTVTINGHLVSGSPSLTALDVGTVAAVSTDAVAGQALVFNGSTYINSSIPTSAGAGVSYFFTNTDSGVAGYEIISKTPDTVGEQTEAIVVTAGTSPIYLDHAYLTDTAIGVTTLDAGLWAFDMYAHCSATNGTNTLTIEAYKRTSGGTETLLFSASTSGSIVDNVTELYPIKTVQPAFSCNATDKLVFKIKVSTDRSSSTTISFIHSGTTHYSNIQTPLSIPHNNLLGTQGGDDGEKYHLNLAHYTIATQAATASLSGYLSSVKFAEFDAKQSAITNLAINKGGTNSTSYTAASGTQCGIIFYNSTSLTNDATLSDLSYDTATNAFYCNNAIMSSLTASTVVYADANKKIVSSSVTPTQLSYLDATSSIQTQLNGKQASGSYLTSSSPSITSPTIATSLTASYATASTIAGFDASKNLITLATATYPNLTELAYVKGVTSAIQTQLDSKQASGSYITASSTDTLTNKRITNRVLSEASNASVTVNSDSYDVYEAYAQTAAILFNNPTGTPTNQQILQLIIASSTTAARAITYGTAFVSSTITLPTTTAATTQPITITLQYHSNYAGGGKWVCKGVA